MTTLNYARRALARARERGISDALSYSCGVIQNAAMNLYLDLRYCGKISRTRHTASEITDEYHAVEHTEWRYLNNVFQEVEISKDDVLVDVGCGDGRVLAYWLHRGIKNRIVGIEIDPATALDTSRRFQRFKNVEILCGDAADLVRESSGTLFYLFNPFHGRPLERFASAFRATQGSRVVLYCYNDLGPFQACKVRIFLKKDQDPAYRFAVITLPN